MRLISLLTVVSFVGGCATVPPAPVVPDLAEKRVEERALPKDPQSEPLPEKMPKGEWVESMEAGGCWGADGKAPSDAPTPCPGKSGLLFSEEKAYRLQLYKLGYQELRADYEADRKVWAAQRELYEWEVAAARKKLQDAEPGWIDSHKLEIGFILGAAMATAIVYAEHQASK